MAHRGEGLYEKYAHSVYRYLFSITGDADIAEELTQETFCQALKSIGSYRGDSTPQVWLCAIAKRLWFKELERRRRSPVIDDAALENAAAPDDPARDVEERLDRIELYRAMQRLDADTLEVMHLRLGGDFSFREIGEILGKSEVWARVRFYRGKEQLIKILGGENNAQK